MRGLHPWVSWGDVVMTGIQLGYTVTSFYKKGLKKVPAELSQDGPTGADRQKKEEGRGEDGG